MKGMKGDGSFKATSQPKTDHWDVSWLAVKAVNPWARSPFVRIGEQVVSNVQFKYNPLHFIVRWTSPDFVSHTNPKFQQEWISLRSQAQPPCAQGYSIGSDPITDMLFSFSFPLTLVTESFLLKDLSRGLIDPSLESIFLDFCFSFAKNPSSKRPHPGLPSQGLVS